MAVRVSKADFEEKVLKEALPVLVDFYSDSCVACKKLAPAWEMRKMIMKIRSKSIK